VPQHPLAAEKHDAEERQGLLLHLGRGVDQRQQRRRQEVTQRGQHQERQRDGGEKCLVDSPIHFLRITRPGKAGHQDAHPGEQRIDEDDDDDEDLETHADRGIAPEAHQVSDQRVIHHPLQPADHVGEHGRPGDPPDRRPQRSLDNRPVVPGFLDRRHMALRET
jgi:hypothetical protein